MIAVLDGNDFYDAETGEHLATAPFSVYTEDDKKRAWEWFENE